MSQCRSCGARVTWAKTANDKAIPLDPEPVASGNVELVNGRAAIVKPSPDVRRYVSHFSTCPNASQHRRTHAR